MSFIHPNMQSKFEELSGDLKNAILQKNLQINTMQDLINALQQIITEGE